MGIKVAVIGGGSTYTPELVEGLANRRARLPIDELVLHDIDPERRRIVGGLADRMLRRMEWDGRLTLTGDATAAIDGADFVLIQLRIGGQAARLLDETLPLRFGTIGQETTGAGGFAKALRTVPVVLELAELVRRHAAPDAWIIDFTNPVGIVTQALRRRRAPRAGPVQRGDLAPAPAGGAPGRRAGSAHHRPRRAQPPELDHRRAGRRRSIACPSCSTGTGRPIAADLQLPVEQLREIGAVPSYYLRYYYAFDEVLAEQRGGHHRAEEVMELERRLLEMYADPALDTKPALLNDRGGAFYSEAAAQLLASLHDGAGDVQVVDVRNGDAVAGLPPDEVVEVPARIDRSGAHPLPQLPMSAEMLALVRAAKEYERLAIRAARSGAREDARLALEANPLVGPRIGDVVPLLDALLEANQAHLPQFAIS